MVSAATCVLGGRNGKNMACVLFQQKNTGLMKEEEKNLMIGSA